MHGINRIYTHMGTNIEELYKAAPEYKHDGDTDAKINELKQIVKNRSEFFSNPVEVSFIEKDLDTLASIVALPGVFLFFGLLMTVFC